MKQVILVVFFFSLSILYAFEYPSLAFLLPDIGLSKTEIQKGYPNVVTGRETGSLVQKSGNTEYRIWKFDGNGKCKYSEILISYTGTSSQFNDYENFWINMGYTVTEKEENKQYNALAVSLLSWNKYARLNIIDYKGEKMLQVSIEAIRAEQSAVCPLEGEWFVEERVGDIKNNEMILLPRNAIIKTTYNFNGNKFSYKEDTTETNGFVFLHLGTFEYAQSAFITDIIEITIIADGKKSDKKPDNRDSLRHSYKYKFQQDKLI